MRQLTNTRTNLTISLIIAPITTPKHMRLEGEEQKMSVSYY